MFEDLCTWLGSWFVNLANSAWSRLFAIKAFLFSLTGLIIPAVLYKFINAVFTEMLSMALSFLTTYSTGAYEVAGVTGWICLSLSLPQCLSIIVSAMAIKLLMGLIPFINI